LACWLAGVSAAVRAGHPPWRNKLLKSSGYLRIAEKPGVLSGRQLPTFGSQDGR
jgi:hypothetical protein